MKFLHVYFLLNCGKHRFRQQTDANVIELARPRLPKSIAEPQRNRQSVS